MKDAAGARVSAPIVVAALLLGLPASVGAAVRTSTDYRSPGESLNAGGTALGSASYTGLGTLGELAGDQDSSSYSIRGGYGQLFSEVGPGVPAITVTTLGDAGAGTLRQAIVDANLRPGPDAIVIALAEGATGTIELSSALPGVTGSLEIVGPGAERLTLQPRGFGNFHAIAASRTATNFGMSGMRFSSFFGENGAIIASDVALTVSGCVFDANSSPAVSVIRATRSQRVTVSSCVFSNNAGTAVHLDGVESFSISGSVFVGNATDAEGGALRVTASSLGTTVGNLDHVLFEENTASTGGALSLTGEFPSVIDISSSTFRDNAATSRGGAVRNRGGTLRLVQCTLSGNSAGEAGGALGNGTSGSVAALAILQNCTVTDNVALPILGSADGGGIASAGTGESRVTLRNTVVAGNLDLDPAQLSPDVFGSVSSEGYNLIGVANGVSGWLPSDLTGTASVPMNPGLGALDDNGGATPTHLPMPGSPALDRGDLTGSALITDQRGRPRVVDLRDVDNARGGDGSDIGAVEAEKGSDNPTLPDILVQPRDVLVVRDGSGPVPAVLRVQAVDTDTYEWYVVREGITNRVDGAAGDTLRFENMRRSDAGIYFVVLANHVGRVVSDGARLRLLVAQRLLAPERTDAGQLRLRFADLDGAVPTDPGSFELQVTTNLEGAATAWRTLPVPVVVEQGGLRCDLPAVPAGARTFYRVVER